MYNTVDLQALQVVVAVLLTGRKGTHLQEQEEARDRNIEQVALLQYVNIYLIYIF